ncbi:hypothetical protein [Streptomyces fildesensis]|uniref:hypothetical protein n=1 Tax=Streptomyces fildesensis TaxID=375757 RepID=UPI0018DF4FCB|nr:hypothetical protein [Streptomyces fildesensis]
MMGQVSIRQALRLLAGTWLFIGVAYLVLWLVPYGAGLPVWAPAAMYLGGWWRRHHLSIWAGVAAAAASCAAGFFLVDALRERLVPSIADVLAPTIAVLVAALVLVVWTQRPRAQTGTGGVSTPSGDASVGSRD